MMRTHLWVTKASHHHNVVVSKLAWRIHSLLDIDVLALELLNLPFDRVLHEVLLLSLVQLSWIHLSWLLRWVEAIASGRLFLAILVLSELAVVAQWWRRWDTDACWIAVVAKGTELDCFVIVLGLRRIWMVLQSLRTPAVQQVIMQDLSSLSLDTTHGIAVWYALINQCHIGL